MKLVTHNYICDYGKKDIFQTDFENLKVLKSNTQINAIIQNPCLSFVYESGNGPRHV